MKKLYKAFLIAAAMTTVLALAACSDDDDDNGSSTPTATLPASVGTNEVSGKTWKETSSSGDTTTLVFTDSTATETTINSKNETSVDKYRYTYDSEKKLIHLALISWDEDVGETVSSVSDYVALCKEDYEADEWTNILSAYYTAEGKAIFSAVETRKYEIDGSSLKLSNPTYFNGLPPTKVFFSGSDIEIYNFGRIKIEDNGTSFEVFPTYKDSSFTGTVFVSKKGEEASETAGTISGTYTTNGTGFTGCTIKLTFTSLPSAITGVTKNTEYTLSQSTDSDFAESYTTYTLVN